MISNESYPVDALIEAALADEPLRPVPENFQQRLAGRLRIAALLREECRRFRTAVGMAGLAAAATVGCAVLFAAFADIPGLLTHGVPGGMGLFDYLTTYAALTWSDAGSSLVLTLVPVAAVTMVLLLVPLRWLTTWRQHPTPNH